MLPASDPLIATPRKHNVYEATQRSDAGAPARPALNIAISRQAGSGGVEVARLVAQRSGWDLYDHQLLERMAREWDLPEGLLEGVDERHVGWIEEIAANFSSVRGGQREGAYLPSLRAVLRALSKQGHCVVLGRGST